MPTIKDLINQIANKSPEISQILDMMLDLTDKTRVDLDNLSNGLITPDFIYGHSHAPKQARIRSATDFSVANNVLTIVDFTDGLLDFDTDNMWDSAANPNRLYFRTPGKYIVGGCVTWEASAAGRRELYLVKDGTTTINFDSRAHTLAGQTGQNVVTIYEFGRDSYIELVALQASGAALNALAKDAFASCLWAVMTERGRNKGTGTENLIAGEI